MRTSPLNVVILAAGKGTRMQSDLPKVLHPIAGQPMLRHVLNTADQLEPEKICVVYGFGGELVPKTIADEEVQWVLQAEQNGTGHAVQQALPYLDDDAIALVLLGDVPLIEAATCKTVVHQAEKGQLVLLTMLKEDPTGYGRIVRDIENHVIGIVEHRDASEDQRAIREVNTGIMAMPIAHLRTWLQRLSNDNAQGEYYLTDIVAMAVAGGVRVTSVQVMQEQEAMGINSKAELARAERLYQQAYASRLLEHGTTLADPARIDVRGSLVCGKDVYIDINCVFEGEVRLGNGVRIGANCVIRNAEIGAGTQVQPFSCIDGAQIAQEAIIGPYARLRPGTELGKRVHIGNFVELKNSQVQADSKINHLSYVGDSRVGREVNIGAGTITCNYDGANKHRTIIGDGAFIGSDTQLIAPVEIGAGATIAAGSTITKNAPAGELTLARSKQVTISGWKRPEKKK